jgi:hypothetical protein
MKKKKKKKKKKKTWRDQQKLARERKAFLKETAGSVGTRWRVNLGQW